MFVEQWFPGKYFQSGGSFSGPRGLVSEKARSQIPYGWQVLHALLCIIGVNNVFFMKSLPISLRLASLIYHAAVLCVSTPVLILYIYNITWETAITSIAERLTLILSNSSVIILGSVYMINALKTNRATEFLKQWRSFCSYKTEWFENVETKGFTKARIALVFSTVFHIVLCVTVTIQLSSLMEYSQQCGMTFPLPNEPWLVKIACGIFTVMYNVSSFSVSLTTCYFALVTITLAEESNKLYQVICRLASSSCPVMSAWEQVRFRHEALVSLVALHDQLSTMLLGPILVGNTISLCSSLYYVAAVYTSEITIINAIMPIAVLWPILITPSILDNMVSEIQCRAVIMRSIFSQKLKKLGRGVGCLLWVQPLIGILPEFL